MTKEFPLSIDWSMFCGTVMQVHACMISAHVWTPTTSMVIPLKKKKDTLQVADIVVSDQRKIWYRTITRLSTLVCNRDYLYYYWISVQKGRIKRDWHVRASPAWRPSWNTVELATEGGVAERPIYLLPFAWACLRFIFTIEVLERCILLVGEHKTSSRVSTASLEWRRTFSPMTKPPRIEA